MFVIYKASLMELLVVIKSRIVLDFYGELTETSECLPCMKPYARHSETSLECKGQVTLEWGKLHTQCGRGRGNM